MPIVPARHEVKTLCRELATFVVSCAILLMAPLASIAQQRQYLACDLELRNSFGPFDYRTAAEEHRRIVEDNHFTSQVENLTRGITGSLGGDIDYTLRAFPNHPRALLAMANLGRREGREKPVGSRHSVDCWFQRALAFQPEDPFVRTAYGVELLRSGRPDASIEQLKVAEKLRGNDANVSYNLGLAYFDLKDYNSSLEHARRAYELGFPLPGLKNKLQRIGKWAE
jgi:tetratricopeptide (TPR) repeat protein